MYNFIFKMADGTKNIINNIPAGFDKAIWEQIDEYCLMFESESNKVVSVIQKAI